MNKADELLRQVVSHTGSRIDSYGNIHYGYIHSGLLSDIRAYIKEVDELDKKKDITRRRKIKEKTLNRLAIFIVAFIIATPATDTLSEAVLGAFAIIVIAWAIGRVMKMIDRKLKDSFNW